MQLSKTACTNYCFSTSNFVKAILEVTSTYLVVRLARSRQPFLEHSKSHFALYYRKITQEATNPIFDFIFKVGVDS